MQGITEIHENSVSRKFGAIWYVPIQSMLTYTSLAKHKVIYNNQVTEVFYLPYSRKVWQGKSLVN